MRTERSWVETKFDTGEYKSGEISGHPTDPALQKELEDFMNREA